MPRQNGKNVGQNGKNVGQNGKDTFGKAPCYNTVENWVKKDAKCGILCRSELNLFVSISRIMRVSDPNGFYRPQICTDEEPKARID